MQCSISGEVANEPVFAASTGLVYEKRVLLKALNSNGGLCPVTQKALSPDELLNVQSNPIVKPRPSTAHSVPSMIQLFQNEWDTLMLESYQLKHQLENTRQELAHSLYQHDAACRVIARLVKERDEARSQLANYKSTKKPQETEDKMEVESNQTQVLPSEIISKFTETNAKLSKERKSRSVPATLASADDIKDYQVNVNKNTKTPLHAVDVHLTGDRILVGGDEGHLVVYENHGNKIHKNFKGHTDRVNDVLVHPTAPVYVSASSDKTARVWKDDSEKAVNVTSNHTNDVTGVSLQPGGDYFCSVSTDSSWGIHNFETPSPLINVNSQNPLTAVNFHPDGFLLCIGENNGVIRLWDVRSSKSVIDFNGHSNSVNSVIFSENGYYLASAAEESTVQLWDLRNQKNTNSITVKGTARSVSFDHSGKYLAVASTEGVS
eukprot:TRINITY_DN1654_c0_g1_i2.p1 TRINITY_DN1654_c0_g1~~TRINITY_DN1654_c0_g1_i2.p1  ORF type:complete len:435 (+),score=158.45 TRINITY_DN1654_c0_g1_i2:492-1796(+)